MIHHLRGEVAEADRLLDSLKRVSDSAGSGRGSIRPWTSAMPLMVARGELEGARARIVDRVPGWQVHGDTFFEAAGAWAAAAEAWDRVPSLMEEMRTFAVGGCQPAAWHADLLEGRWMAAAARPTDAIAAFDRARTAFASAGAVRDAAICDLDVARVFGLDALDSGPSTTTGRGHRPLRATAFGARPRPRPRALARPDALVLGQSPLNPLRVVAYPPWNASTSRWWAGARRGSPRATS